MERAREQMGNGLPSFTGKFQTLLGFLAPAGFVLSAVWHLSCPNLCVVSRSLAGCRTGRAQPHFATHWLCQQLPSSPARSQVDLLLPLHSNHHHQPHS